MNTSNYQKRSKDQKKTFACALQNWCSEKNWKCSREMSESCFSNFNLWLYSYGILSGLSITFFFKKVKTFFRESRGGSRTAATSKMERFVIIVGAWKPLTIITKHSILVIAAALHPPVVSYLTKYFWLFVKSVYLFSESNTYIVSIRLHKGNYRNRNIHRELFHKKSASKNFANLMGKNLWWSPFLVKLYPATFLRRLASQVFSYNFCKVLYITSGQHFLNK